jgi:hypothetical protein
MSIWEILNGWDYDGAYMDIYGPFCCTLGIYLAAYDHERLGDITIRVVYWIRKGEFEAYAGHYTNVMMEVGP